MNKMLLGAGLMALFIGLVYLLFFYTTKGTVSISNTVTGPGQQAREVMNKDRLADIASAPTYQPVRAGARTIKPLHGVVVVPGQPTTLGGRIKEQVTTGRVVLSAGYGMYMAPNLQREAINKMLVSHRLPAGASMEYASVIESALKNRLFSNASVLVTASGVALTVEEFVCPNVSFWTRVLIALGIGIVFMLLYMLAVNKGKMT